MILGTKVDNSGLKIFIISGANFQTNFALHLFDLELTLFKIVIFTYFNSVRNMYNSPVIELKFDRTCNFVLAASLIGSAKVGEELSPLVNNISSMYHQSSFFFNKKIFSFN